MLKIPDVMLLHVHAGQAPVRRVQKLSMRPTTQRLRAVLPCRRLVQQRGAAVNACSSAAASPASGPSKPVLGGILAVFAAFLRAASHAMQRTAQRVRQSDCSACVSQAVLHSLKHTGAFGSCMPFVQTQTRGRELAM